MFVCLFHGLTAPSRPGPPHFRHFTITLKHTTVGRTPLDEWSARRSHLYLTTQNNLQETYPCTRRYSNPRSQKVNGLRSIDCAATGVGMHACPRVCVCLYVYVCVCVFNCWYILWRLQLTLPTLRRTNYMKHRRSIAITVASSQKIPSIWWNPNIYPLNTKRRLLYLKTQFVPHSKHFSSRL